MKRFCFFFCLSVFLVSCKFKPCDSVLGCRGENFIALNKNARDAKSTKSKKQYMFYKFTLNQQAHASNIAADEKGGSLSVKFNFDKMKKNSSCSFEYGFLYSSDFSEEGELERTSGFIKTAHGVLSKADYKKVRLLLTIDKNEEEPCGFFVCADVPYSLSDVSFDVAKCGWSRENGEAFFAFGPEGGEADFSFSKTSFCKFENSYIELGLSANDDIGTYDRQKTIDVRVADENLGIRCTKKARKTILHSKAFRKNIDDISFYNNKEVVESVFIYPNARGYEQENSDVVTIPLKTDLGLVTAWPQEKWRNPDYELFEWELFPGVLFIDFKDYKVQNEFFTRLAYFVEKTGYKGTLVDDDFVENKHGYNAHDYKAADLADFFTVARRQNFKLNYNENRLKQILLQNKIIFEDADGYYSRENYGAVVSFSRESNAGLRSTFLAHESWHGIYFSDSDFRNFVSVQYNMFDFDSMDFLKTFWELQPGLEYDRSDEYLMQNEFMAYHMQQSLGNTRQYFLHICNRGSVQRDQKKQAEYVKSINAQPFVDACDAFNTYAFLTWGLASGRVTLMYRF